MDLCKVNLFLLLCNLSLGSDTDERCPKTLILENGQVKFQSRGGVTAVFTCNSGYALRGSNVSHCQTDGHWSSPTPFCELQGKQCSEMEIETLFILPGQLTNISCFSNGMYVFWTRNGITAETTYMINGNLILSANDEGTYLCLTFSNTIARILAAIKIVFNHEKSLMRKDNKCELSFKDNVKSINKSIGSNLLLSCEVNSSTAQITWLKNGETIHDKYLSYSKTELNISKLMKENEGNYTCFVQEKDFPECTVSKSVRVRVHNSIYLLPSNSCGQPVVRRSKRVIDGTRAAPLSAPWMCMLSLDREPPFCGCSLISSKWIITAAHCFKMTNQKIVSMMTQEDIQKKVRVKFGKQQRRQIEKGEIVRGVQSMFAYPQYRPDSSNKNITNEHDIAILELDVPVVFQSNILPICLPPSGFTESVPVGTLGIVTGWGRVSVRDSVMALTLQEAFLPLVNNSSCQSRTGYIITDNMLCAGYAESYRPDTCYGDSGGPFILKRHDSWYLAGIVSWGEGCSSPMKYGIYTKVEKYVPWIHSIWDKNLLK